MSLQRSEVLRRAVVGSDRRFKSGNELHRLGAAAEVLLLTASCQQRGNAYALSDIERADTLACVYLVAGNADKVAVQRDFQESLNCVDMYDGFRILPLDQPVQPLYVVGEAGLVVDRMQDTSTVCSSTASASACTKSG